MNIALWIIQILLALLFLFAGGTKLYFPPEVLAAKGPPNQVHLPGLFIQFIGVCEVLGALGLVLPGPRRCGPADYHDRRGGGNDCRPGCGGRDTTARDRTALRLRRVRQANAIKLGLETR